MLLSILKYLYYMYEIAIRYQYVCICEIYGIMVEHKNQSILPHINISVQ